MATNIVYKLLRAANARRIAANVLYQNQLYLDSMYLAGYTVECALKAAVLSGIAVGKRDSFARERFRTAKAHSFEWLRSLLNKRGVMVPSAVSRALRTIGSWSPTFRYDAAQRRAEEAAAFLQAADEILHWCRIKVSP